MNYLIIILVLILVALVAFWVGYWHKRGASQNDKRKNNLAGVNALGEAQKEANKNSILKYAEKHGRIANRQAKELCGVSESMAEAYLDELEKEGKLIQHGQVGAGVFYTLK